MEGDQCAASRLIFLRPLYFVLARPKVFIQEAVIFFFLML